MIVKNERGNLGRCLDSVGDLADEKVVVDTGSDDGTQDVARCRGARLVQSTWTNDFSAARNVSLDHATGEWILVLDADEYLEAAAKKQIQALISEATGPEGPSAVAFNMINKSTSDGGRTGTIAHLIRLFPNRPDVRYCWPIHEQVAPSLQKAGVRVVTTDVVILHSGYSDPERNRRKQRRNLAILETQIASGKDVNALTYFMHAGCHLDLGEFEAALSAYEHCRKVADESGAVDIAAGAFVRTAECLVQLRRFSQVLERAGGEPDGTWHPELLAFRAAAEAALGRHDDARRSYEVVFRCADVPRIPACNLPRVKMEALKFLAEYWNARGNSRRAVQLLRSGVALRTEGSAFSAEHLKRCYAETE